MKLVPMFDWDGNCVCVYANRVACVYCFLEAGLKDDLNRRFGIGHVAEIHVSS